MRRASIGQTERVIEPRDEALTPYLYGREDSVGSFKQSPSRPTTTGAAGREGAASNAHESAVGKAATSFNNRHREYSGAARLLLGELLKPPEGTNPVRTNFRFVDSLNEVRRSERCRTHARTHTRTRTHAHARTRARAHALTRKRTHVHATQPRES